MWWIIVVGKGLRLGKNLYAVRAVYSVACLEWYRGIACMKPVLQKRIESETVLSRKTPRLFLTGMPVRD